MVKTNDLKKGTRVRLTNGWEATLLDNTKGNIRLMRVEGNYTEVGSEYAHKIAEALVGGAWVKVEHTQKQLDVKKMNDILFGG
jgi:hypothetical protein